MVAISAHFDGRYLVPDEPVKLPQNKPLKVHIDIDEPASNDEESRLVSSFLDDLKKDADKLPADPNLPADGAAQHDHYLFGTPKS